MCDVTIYNERVKFFRHKKLAFVVLPFAQIDHSNLTVFLKEFLTAPQRKVKRGILLGGGGGGGGGGGEILLSGFGNGCKNFSHKILNLEDAMF